jgi:predicted SAM-dependent methyltransferase
MTSTHVQYGCGLSAPREWTNFDASPTLRIQKTPIIGTLLKGRLNVTFPSNVLYGDIVAGLPVKADSCDGVYCSHVLEHLSLEDFRAALRNTYKILKKGGIFRCVVPDLEKLAHEYVDAVNTGDPQASIKFVGYNTILGTESRPKGIKGLMNTFLGNANHLWMWDQLSLANELKNAGFTSIRNCKFNDSSDPMFKLVEDPVRFEGAVAIECKK